jgi:hypothetical protein
MAIMVRPSPGCGRANVLAYGGGDTNTIVVDLKKMKALSWDYNTWTAHVSGSWTLGDLTTAMIDAGNRMFAHGTCPQVGRTLIQSSHAKI